MSVKMRFCWIFQVVRFARRHLGEKSTWTIISDLTAEKHLFGKHSGWRMNYWITLVQSFILMSQLKCVFFSGVSIVQSVLHAESICRITLGSKNTFFSHFTDQIIFEFIRRHTGDTPFKCDICKKSFTRKEHYVNHYMWHTGEVTNSLFIRHSFTSIAIIFAQNFDFLLLY